MRKALGFGIVVFLAVLVLRAPTSLLAGILEATTSGATLLDARGTLWNGQAALLLAGQPLGTVAWTIKPVTLLQGKLRYHLSLAGSDHGLEGEVEVAPARSSVTLSGSVDHAAVNRWLQPYDIALSGRFQLEDTRLEIRDGVPAAADGQVTWSGGPVTYRLSGKISTENLPEMVALLGPGPEAVVFASGGQTPLLKLELQENGFARVGVTKLLTKLLNSPWPGADPDHAVVLEVEEQVF